MAKTNHRDGTRKRRSYGPDRGAPNVAADVKEEARTKRRAKEREAIERIRNGVDDAPVPERNAEAGDRWNWD